MLLQSCIEAEPCWSPMHSILLSIPWHRLHARMAGSACACTRGRPPASRCRASRAYGARSCWTSRTWPASTCPSCPATTTAWRCSCARAARAPRPPPGRRDPTASCRPGASCAARLWPRACMARQARRVVFATSWLPASVLACLLNRRRPSASANDRELQGIVRCMASQCAVVALPLQATGRAAAAASELCKHVFEQLCAISRKEQVPCSWHEK